MLLDCTNDLVVFRGSVEECILSMYNCSISCFFFFACRSCIEGHDPSALCLIPTDWGPFEEMTRVLLGSSSNKIKYPRNFPLLMLLDTFTIVCKAQVFSMGSVLLNHECLFFFSGKDNTTTCFFYLLSYSRLKMW